MHLGFVGGAQVDVMAVFLGMMGTVEQLVLYHGQFLATRLSSLIETMSCLFPGVQRGDVGEFFDEVPQGSGAGVQIG